MMDGRDTKVLWDYIRLQALGITSSIVSSAIEGKNFKLNPALITVAGRDKFSEHSLDNPNVYVCKFFAKCDTIKLNGVSTDAIQLRLFPFSFKDRANDWLQNKGPNSFSTYEALSKAFLRQCFPPSKTTKPKTNITSFSL